MDKKELFHLRPLSCSEENLESVKDTFIARLIMAMPASELQTLYEALNYNILRYPKPIQSQLTEEEFDFHRNELFRYFIWSNFIYQALQEKRCR